MKLHVLKFVTLVALLASWFSCAKDDKKDDDNMVSIKIEDWKGEVDPYIVSFALPGIVDSRCYNGMPYLSSGEFPGELGLNDWSIHLTMEKGTDCTQLAPIITLVSGAVIKEVWYFIDGQIISKQVNYSGIAEVGTYDFTKQVDFVLIAPDGSQVTYSFIAFSYM